MITIRSASALTNNLNLNAMRYIEFLLDFISDLPMHDIHFIFRQVSLHMTIDNSKTQTIFLLFRMEKSVDYFDLIEKKVNTVIRRFLYGDCFRIKLTCSTRSPPASRTSA